MTTTLAPRSIANPVIRDTVTFLELSAETGGKFSLLQLELAPSGGNALHFHRRLNETFSCVDGTLGVQTGTTTRLLAPGQSLTVKAGAVHRFSNPSADRSVSFNVLIDPGSPGFEAMLQVAYGLAADGLTNGKGVPSNPYHTPLIIRWRHQHARFVVPARSSLSLAGLARREERNRSGADRPILPVLSAPAFARARLIGRPIPSLKHAEPRGGQAVPAQDGKAWRCSS